MHDSDIISAEIILNHIEANFGTEGLEEAIGRLGGSMTDDDTEDWVISTSTKLGFWVAFSIYLLMKRTILSVAVVQRSLDQLSIGASDIALENPRVIAAVLSTTNGSPASVIGVRVGVNDVIEAVSALYKYLGK